jgi:hypothetical protein
MYMIGFAPFEAPVAVRKKSLRKNQPVAFKKECTECNYIVLFFVIGVMLLALGDTFKRG